MLSRNNKTEKNHFDALIIGAGPAGATAAYMLAASGFKVAVIEKRQFPRFKLCGGLLTQKTIGLLKDIFNTNVCDLKSEGAIQYQSNFYGVGDHNGNYLQRKLDFPFHFADRAIYDACWLDKAVKAGANVIFKESVENVDIATGEIITRTGNRFSGRYIIAADGVFSRVRSILHQRNLLKCRHRQDIAAALETFIPRGKIRELPDYPVIFYGYIPWGYAWSFPGPNSQIFGLCSLKGKAKQSLFKGFNTFIQAQGVRPENLVKPKGYALPYGNFLSKAGYKNILLVGDAGGFADPLLGEGIYYAHKSAQMAVDAVKHSWGHPQKAEAIYSQLLNKDVTAELKYAKMIRQFLFSLPTRRQLKVLGFIFKKLSPKLEEAVQGQRSFKLLLPRSRI